MSVRKFWIAAAVILFGLGGAAQAETTPRQPDDRAAGPATGIGPGLAALLGQERAGLDAVAPGRLEAIVTPPAAGGRARGAAIVYDEAWLAAQPAPRGGPEFECLARAVYFEARGESVAGQAAVAEVILNRVESPSFPHTICGVVQQSNAQGCQFSYVCDGRADRIGDRAAWIRAGKIARAMIEGAPRVLTGGATHFHTPAVRPAWSRRFERTAMIGRHIFYRAPVRTAMN